MKKVAVIQGPNLNLLGMREPAIYGHLTLQTIHDTLLNKAVQHHISIDFFQSNHEGALVDYIQSLKAIDVTHIIINAAAYTHTSIAIRDALTYVALPFIEVHLSNIYHREPFRHHSYLSDIAMGSITGLGSIGYSLALDAIINL
jgi:3-dehydroquinate dehydratase-2